jgi:hypothetical protein
MTRTLPCALAILITLIVPIGATPPNPIVSSLFVPIEGDLLEPGTNNLLHLTGEVHVVTHYTVVVSTRQMLVGRRRHTRHDDPGKLVTNARFGRGATQSL